MYIHTFISSFGFSVITDDRFQLQERFFFLITVPLINCIYWSIDVENGNLMPFRPRFNSLILYSVIVVNQQVASQQLPCSSGNTPRPV